MESSRIHAAIGGNKHFALVISQRWQCQEKLHFEAGIETFRGNDRCTGQPVVMRVGACAIDRWLSLQSRLRVLESAPHPSVQRILHFERVSQEAAVEVAEFAPGPTLEERLRDGPATWQEAAPALLSWLEVLEHAHAQGLLHTNLKPSNLVVAKDRVVVLDWGFSRDRAEPWQAPEVTGCVESEVGPACDLWSVGVTAFRWLLGRHPWEAGSRTELFRLQMTAPPDLSHSELPFALKVWLLSLLIPEPERRCRSAAEARAALLGRPVPARLSSPPLIERETQLQRLREGTVALVVAPAGGGKTALLEAACREALRRGSFVLRARGGERTIAAQLLHGIARRSDLAHVLDELGGFAPVLARLAPELAVPSAPGDEPMARKRVSLALYELLLRLDRGEHSLFIAIDDLHAAEPDALELLRMAFRMAPFARLQLVAGARPLPDLEDLPERIELPCLSPGAADKLLRALRPTLEGEERRAWLRLAEGNPAALKFGPLGDLERLAATTLQILQAGSILGVTFSAPVLELVCPGPVRAALEEAREAGILWRSADRWHYAHELVREELLKRLSSAKKVELHRAAALALEAFQAAPPGVIARHFQEAGLLSQALPHARTAATLARREYAFHTAERAYRIALQADSESVEAHRGLAEVLRAQGDLPAAVEAYERCLELAEDDGVRLELGRTYWTIGSYPEARSCVERVLRRRTPSPLLELMGAAAGIVAPWPRRKACLEPSAWALLCEVAFHQGDRGLGMAAAARLLEWTRRDPDHPESLRARALVNAVEALFLRRGAGVVERGLRLTHRARERQDPLLLAQVLTRANVASVLTLPLERWEALYEEAATIFLRAGDLWEHAQARWILGLALYATGPLSLLQAQARALYQLARAQNHSLASLVGFSLWALATGGRVPAGVLQWAATAKLSGQGELHHRLGMALCSAAKEQWREAADWTRFPGLRWIPPVERAWLLNHRTTCLREAYEREDTPWMRRSLLQQALRTNQQALTLPYPLTRAAALREAALLACFQGRFAKAESCFRQALSTQYPYERALTRYECERIRGLRGLPGKVAEARHDLIALGAFWLRPAAEPPLALRDRFEQILDWGRRLSRSPDEATVHANLRAAALDLLRCPEASVVPHPGEGGMRAPMFGGRWLWLPDFLPGEQDQDVVRFLVVTAEAALSRCLSRVRHESVFRLSGLGLAWLDASGRIREWNAALEEMVEARSLRGRRLTEFLVSEQSSGKLELCSGRIVFAIRARIGEEHLVALSRISPQRREHLQRFQEIERRLLAAQLQDAVQAPLSSLSEKLQREPPPLALLSDETLRLAHGIGELIYNLRNPVMEGDGVLEGLRRYLIWFRDRCDFELNGVIPERSNLSGTVAIFAYRIVQEALLNARNFSGPSRVWVHLSLTPGGGVQGEIVDDGVGLDLERCGDGLNGMRLRAELLGGELRVQSSAGEGTRVEFQLPARV